jgi:hypothetical protein
MQLPSVIRNRRSRARFVASVLFTVAVLLTSCSSPSSPTRTAGSHTTVRANPPPAVATTVSRLGSSSIAVQRSALSPQIEKVISSGAAFPAGTRILLVPDTWNATGPYANAHATVSEPGDQAQLYEFGFVNVDGTWLVTFAEPIQ